MRVLIFAALVALAACASGGGESPSDQSRTGDFPFPVERGTALPPPTGASASQSAPPQGAGAGGLDFGQWRAADPATYAPAFQTRVRERFAGRDRAAIKADLEANGFTCQDGERLDCRIEIMEQQCAVDWYVVLERNRAEPIAGFDRMCLGAR
jgi:hypothetical protein